MAASGTLANRGRFLGWRMLAIAFLAQNCAIGLNFGAYGTLIPAIQSTFSASRALASSGMAVMTLSMGLASPLVGMLMQRFSLRSLMMSGALICVIGYGSLPLMHNIYLLLAEYALLIGPGVCLMGVIPSSALAGNWFEEGRGRALGVVNTSVSMVVMPPLVAAMLGSYGLSATFLMVAAILLCLLPVLRFVVTRPEDVGQQPHGKTAAVRPAPAPTLTSRQILVSPPFIVLTLGIGFITMAGVMIVTHLVSFAHDRGIPLQRASMLLSAFAITSTLGGPIFGWLADRIGPRIALVTLSFGSLVPWTALLVVPSSLPALVGISGLLGLFSGGINPLLTAVMSTWMGQSNFGRAMGLCYFLKIPFMFGAAPLAGYLFDITGSYRASLLFHMATFVPTGIMFLMFRRRTAPTMPSGVSGDPVPG